MAVPKRKTSKSRRDRRRSNNSKFVLATTHQCPQCRQPKRPHHVCGVCGTYNGRTVVAH
jgi:large subunit ribosomal protein L32